MMPNDEERSEKLKEVAEDCDVLGLIELSRPLLLGLLISLKDKYHEKGLEKIKELKEIKLDEERRLRFYDQRIIKPWMMI